MPAQSPIISTNLRLPSTEYYHAEYRKNLIVLHHTVGGSAVSTFNWWLTDPKRIGTSFLVERDGTIYKVFPSKFWAYHTGKGVNVEKRSIGIEICSEGGLINRKGVFYAFERLMFHGAVYDYGELYRSFRYFAAYTEEQLVAVCDLVAYLIVKYGIPRLVPINKTESHSKYSKFEGIISHTHIRADKTDVHPGFDWKKLIAHCALTEI